MGSDPMAALATGSSGSDKGLTPSFRRKPSVPARIDASPNLGPLIGHTGKVMDRLAQALACGLLLGATALSAGCGSGASGLTTGATLPADAPSGINNEHPMARPISVAYTSARARRCGFYFDPGKLRSAYLAYEVPARRCRRPAGQDPEQLRLHLRHDLAAHRRGRRYCTDKKGVDIKADLQRHLRRRLQCQPAEAGSGVLRLLRLQRFVRRTSRSTARFLEEAGHQSEMRSLNDDPHHLHALAAYQSSA